MFSVSVGSIKKSVRGGSFSCGSCRCCQRATLAAFRRTPRLPPLATRKTFSCLESISLRF